MKTAEIATGTEYAVLPWAPPRDKSIGSVAGSAARAIVTEEPAGGKVTVRYADTGRVSRIPTRQVLQTWEEFAPRLETYREQMRELAESARVHQRQSKEAQVRLLELVGEDALPWWATREIPDDPNLGRYMTRGDVSLLDLLKLVEAALERKDAL